jgi:hypothetical protein
MIDCQNLFYTFIDLANQNKLQQDHPCVLHLIRKLFLRKPASWNNSYYLREPEFINPSKGPSQAVLRLLRNQVNPTLESDISK